MVSNMSRRGPTTRHRNPITVPELIRRLQRIHKSHGSMASLAVMLTGSCQYTLPLLDANINETTGRITLIADFSDTTAAIARRKACELAARKETLTPDQRHARISDVSFTL